MPISGQKGDRAVVSVKETRKHPELSNKEYEEAFNELATFLFTQYKKKKQADLCRAPDDDGQIDNNII